MRYHHFAVVCALGLVCLSGCAGSGGKQAISNDPHPQPDLEQVERNPSGSAATPQVQLASFLDEPIDARPDPATSAADGLQAPAILPERDSSGLAQSTPEGETLQEAWAIAIAVNEKLQSKRNETGAALFAHQAAKSARLPTVRTLTGYTALDKTPGISVSLPGISAVPFGSLPLGEQRFLSSATLATLPLYTHGRIDSAIEASSSVFNASRYDENTIRHDLKMEVAETYVNVLKSQRLVEVTESSVRSLAAHLKDVEDLFDKGVVAKSDVLAVQTAHANAQEEVLKARNGLELASAAYNRLMGRALNEPVIVADLAGNIQQHYGDVENLVGLALTQRSELQSVAHQSWALRHQSDQQRAETGPQVGLIGGFHYLQNRYLTHEDIWSLSLAAEWKLFDGGMSRNKAAALEQQAAATARLQHDLQSRIALQVRQAWLNLQNASERVNVARTAVEYAEENLRVTLDRYRKEVGTNTEVLDAQTRLTLSRSNYLSATYDAALARVMLDRATGSL